MKFKGDDSMDELIKRGYQIKQMLNELNFELQSINLQIADAATYKPGSKTGHLSTPEINVKVTKRENVKWDQERLSEIKAHFLEFDSFVKTEIKPDQRKLKKADSKMMKAFEWCRTVKPGAPSVSYELITEGGE